MTPKNALYQFIEEKIFACDDDSPLAGAVTFNSLRGNVEEAAKVVRVESLTSGRFSLTDDVRCRFKDADYQIQCFVAPDDAESIFSIDEATEESLMMAYEIYRLIAENPTLNGAVEDAHAESNEYDSDTANLGGRVWGATYYYGKINS